MSKKKNRKKKSGIKPKNNPEAATKSSNSIWIWTPLLAGAVLLAVGLYWLKSFNSSKPVVVNEIVEEKDRFKHYETNLSFHDPQIVEQILKVYTDKKTAETIGEAANIEELYFQINKIFNPDYTLTDLNNFLKTCTNEITKSGWGANKIHFSKLTDEEKLSAIATYLINDKKFVYGSSILDMNAEVKGRDGKTKIHEKKKGDTDPTPYLLDTLITKGVGNCATLPVIFTMISRRLGMPVNLVGIKDHMLARFDNGTVKINIETTSDKAMGVGTPDSFYIDLLNPSRRMLKFSTCMKSMNLRETAGALFITQMAYLDKTKAPEEDIKKAIAYSLYFNERSEHAVINALSKFTNKDSTEDPLRERLLYEGQFLGALAPDPQVMINLNTKIIGFRKMVDEITTKLSREHSQRMNAMLTSGQNTMAQINAQNQFYQQVNNSSPEQANQLLRQQRINQLQQQQSKQRADIELKHKLLSDIEYTKKQIEDFTKHNDNDLTFEQIETIQQMLIQNRHAKAEVIRLDRY